MTTNLVCKIFWVVTTNAWITYQTIPPPLDNYIVKDQAGKILAIQPIYLPTTYNQTATISSNLVCETKWEGKDVRGVLKSIDIGTAFQSYSK